MTLTHEHTPRSSLDFKETLQDMYHTDTFRKKFGGMVTHQLVEATTEASIELRDKNRTESGYLTPEGLKYQVLSELNTAVEAKLWLDEHEHQKFRGREYGTFHRYKETISLFNEHLGAWIDHDPKHQLSEVANYLSQYYRAQQAQSLSKMEPRAMKHHLDKVHGDLVQILHGMRNEIGFEQMLGAMEIAGYPIEYDNGSSDDMTHTTEDLHGNDKYVTIDNLRFGIDLKSSQGTEDSKRRAAIINGHNPHTILWSQLEWEDFSGGFRLSPEIVHDKEKMDIIYRKLQEARNSFTPNQIEVMSR